MGRKIEKFTEVVSSILLVSIMMLGIVMCIGSFIGVGYLVYLLVQGL